jgi:transposase-like protein
VCDDNANLKLAARNTFPAVRIQTCFNHFKENIRRDLRVRSDDTYKPFMRRIEAVFKEKLNDASMNKKLFALYRDYRHDPICVQMLATIERYRPELTGYRGIADAPVTTNMIEGLNSHLESRLFSLRSFQSLTHAKLWFNGYILKRRFTTFTDCRGKFRSMNGRRGVDRTKKTEIVLPTFF